MIYICEYDNLAEDRILQERLTTLLLQYKDTDLTGIRWQKLRQRLLARLLLDFALRSEYGLTLPELDLRRGEKGKPYSGAHPEIHFNISHCSTACACITGNEQAGIDVERKFPYRENLARRICHPKEWEVLQALEPDRRDEQLHFLWSLKESFVKWNGEGITYGMDRINLAKYLPVRLLPGQSRRMGGFLLYHTDSFTLAAHAEKLPEEIHYKKEKDLLQVCGVQSRKG
ncbi:MAG: 4'-phosphopantetheinyl transferase superfamily protein [Lachnospiraceae bacterium]|nr:4'-phosphopantetheinyl transferase superfamily protein [Lachnospiraceae bacterium]